MRKNPARLQAQIKKVVASYPDAPRGIEHFTWLSVPKYWESLRVPNPGGRELRIVPRHEDQHGGALFRVGWDEEERVVALWIL